MRLILKEKAEVKKEDLTAQDLKIGDFAIFNNKGNEFIDVIAFFERYNNQVVSLENPIFTWSHEALKHIKVIRKLKPKENCGLMLFVNFIITKKLINHFQEEYKKLWKNKKNMINYTWI